MQKVVLKHNSIKQILKLPYQDFTTIIYESGEEIRVPNKKPK